MRTPGPGPLVLAVLVGAALGCGPPTLDSADLAASIEAVRESVPEARRGELDAALDTVRRASRGEVEGTEPFALDGLDAEAILAEAGRIELRRELVWAEQAVEAERRTVAARETLARLAIRDLATRGDNWGDATATFEVDNGLGEAIDTAWIRLEVERPGRGTVGGDDMVDFRPRLEVGERRKVSVAVSSDASRSLPPDPGTTLRARFTLVERGGEILLQEPSAEALAEAERRLAEAERRRDELRARLAAAG